MVIGCRLQAKHRLLKTMLNLDRLCLNRQPVKTLSAVVKDQSLEKRLSCGRAKEGMVFILGHVDAYNQIVL